MTHRQLEEVSGVSRVAIWRLETGKSSARFDTMRKLAAALGVEPRELVGE